LDTEKINDSKEQTYKVSGCKKKNEERFPYHLSLIYDRGKNVLKEITLRAETLMETGISRNVVARDGTDKPITNVKCV